MANSAFDHSAAITLPSSSTNTALVRWSGTGGNTLTDSTILVGATTMGLAADTDLLTFSNGTLTIGGTLAATTLTGAGSGITGLNASNLGSGTIPDARFPATLPAISGANLTNLPASGATLSGSTNNTVVTVTGANAMIGETGLTFSPEINPPEWVLRVDSEATNVAAVISIEVDASATSDPMLRWREGSGNGDANNQQYEAWMDVENGQFRFRSQNINGSSQEGDIWTVNDGTDDVKFNGNLGIGNAPAGDAKLYVTQGSAGNWVLKLDNTGGSGGHGILMRWTAHTADDNSAVAFHYEDSTALRFRVYSDGDVQNHDNSYGSTSDRRLKENIVDARPALPELEKLRIREFSWISDGLDTADLCGVVAQEVLEAGGYYGGHFIKENGEGYYGAYYSQLVPMLVKAVQELKAEIDALKG